MYLTAHRPPMHMIQLGRRRPEPEDDYDDPWYNEKCPWFICLSRWDNTHPQTWPKDLREFWWKVTRPEDARLMADAILAAYPDDRQLGFLVDWLRFWADRKAHFKVTWE
jgi:hypothetical protein